MTCCTNPAMRQAHIPPSTILFQKCVYSLLQINALSDIFRAHCGITRRFYWNEYDKKASAYCRLFCPGPHLNIKTIFVGIGISVLSYNGNFYTGKTAISYWDGLHCYTVGAETTEHMLQLLMLKSVGTIYLVLIWYKFLWLYYRFPWIPEIDFTIFLGVAQLTLRWSKGFLGVISFDHSQLD